MQIVLLYYIKFTGKEETQDEIAKAVASYAKVTRDDINIQKKEEKYSAYIELPKPAGIYSVTKPYNFAVLRILKSQVPQSMSEDTSLTSKSSSTNSTTKSVNRMSSPISRNSAK